MRWYADNSELNGIKEAEIPDILLFGGIIVSQESEKALKSEFESIKESIAGCRWPMKWNFKDLNRLYKSRKAMKLYDRLLADSQEWRHILFKAADRHEFTIIVACMEAHSKKRQVLKNIKEELTGYVFANGLMRYALHVQENRPFRAEVILDWPDKAQSRPFDFEYSSAYRHGKTTNNIDYLSGPLDDLGFLDSVCFTNMEYSILLQFSDLIVGATREFVEYALGKKKHSFGVDMLNIIHKHFRGYPSDVFNRGLCVTSSTPHFKELIKKAFETTYEVPT